MAEFTYTARNAKNAIRKGSIYAPDRASAVAALQSKKLVPILVKPLKESRKLELPAFLAGKKKVKRQDIVVFTRQLATMSAAGVPILRALNILKSQTESDSLKQILDTVRSDVQGGKSLADALAEHPEAFSSVYVNMVRAGEAGGILDKILDRLALQVEKDASIKGKARGAMIYPAVITLFTLTAFVFVMTGVVPRLAAIFDQFGGELPIYTRLMLAISAGLIRYGIFLLIGLVVGIVFLLRFLKTENGQRWLSRLLLKLPIVKTVVIKSNLARFARTFSSLISAGVSILDCLEITAKSINNRVLRDIILESYQEVKNGKALSDVLLKYPIFPPMLGQMAAVGEETGEIDVVLEKVAEFYEEEVDRTVDNLSSIIEPILIVLLGSIVGLIMASVFGPIASLSGVVP